MMCAWKQLLKILPVWMMSDVDRLGKDCLEELRVREGQPPELVCRNRNLWLERNAGSDDIAFILNTASRYSPWAATTIEKGYITASGGHRIGISGDVVMKNGVMAGIRTVRSLCIRIARDFVGISGKAADLNGSILLIGPPGSGKTTLLRDLSRTIAKKETVCVVDERGELFPDGVNRGRKMDVMSGCPKTEGIGIVLRTMGPSCIAVDEITSERDCEAILKAAWCGVRLIATAHAGSLADMKRRNVYRPLMDTNLFEHVLVLGRDKSWREERAG